MELSVKIVIVTASTARRSRAGLISPASTTAPAAAFFVPALFVVFPLTDKQRDKNGCESRYRRNGEKLHEVDEHDDVNGCLLCHLDDFSRYALLTIFSITRPNFQCLRSFIGL